MTYPFVLALLARLLLAATGHAAEPIAAVVPLDEKPAPIVKLPPEKPTNVAKYDPSAVKARDLPYHVTLVKAPDAWAKNPAAKGKGVRVAVLDTGVQADHPGLHGQVKGLYDAIKRKEGQATDKHGHGTHCCGIVHSIAPEADLYAVKVLSDQGSGSTADIAHGIDYATNVIKADVISMSLGGPDKDPYQQPAIQRAVAAGVVVICAAGNDGPGDTEGYPGRYPESVSVAACDSKRQLAPFSSHGPNVFTADPGVDVLSTLPGNQEGEMSGTSMATPCEAGKCASWIASNGVPKEKGRVDHFRAAVLKASPFKERNNQRGYGLYTLDKVTGEVNTPKPPPTPAPGEKVYTISLAELQRQGYTSVRFDLGSGAAPQSQPIPVASFPVPQPAYHPFTPGVINPVQPAPVFTGPGSVYQGHYPPPVIHQPMPSQCGPGGCQPQPLFPVLRRAFR